MGEGAGVGGGVGARRAADGRLVDVDHLVEMLEPRRCGHARRRLARVVQARAPMRLVERLDGELDLPPPDTPVTQVKVPSGISAVTFFRLLRARRRRVSFLAVDPLRRGFGTSISRRAVQDTGR
jgi:hypothetical protein